MVSKAYKGALRGHPPLPLVLKAHPVSPPIKVKSGGERVMVGLEGTMGEGNWAPTEGCLRLQETHVACLGCPRCPNAGSLGGHV